MQRLLPSTVQRADFAYRIQRAHNLKRVFTVLPSSANQRRFASSGRVERDSQVLNLGDGRRLGFAEYGDAHGFPLFFLHGWPSSRLEPYSLDGWAERHSVRIVAPDRPGFGLSTYAPRTFVDFSEDVQQLADHLELKRFAIMGASGGGPFALACAKAIPRQRLTAVGLFASAGPWRVQSKAGQSSEERNEEKALAGEVLLAQRFIAFGAQHAPIALRLLSDATIWSLHQLVRTSVVSRRIDAFLACQRAKSEGKGKLLESTKRKQMLRAIFEAYAQGCRGTVHEARLLTSAWSRFEETDYPGIRIWHGSRDANAPIRQIRYLADRLPGAILYEHKEDNHFRLADKLSDAIEELVKLAKEG